MVKISVLNDDFKTVEEGLYEAVWMGLKNERTSSFESQDGTYKTIYDATFRIEGDEDYDGTLLSKIVTASLSKRSNLYPIAKALVGRDLLPGEEFDDESYIGTKVQIAVTNVTKNRADGTQATYANISTVMPLKKKAKRNAFLDDEE